MKVFKKLSLIVITLVSLVSLSFACIKVNAATGQDTLACPEGTIVNDTLLSFNTANDKFLVEHKKGSSGTFASYSPWRIYERNIVEFTAKNGEKINSIVITAETTTYATNTVDALIQVKDTLTSQIRTLSGVISANGTTVTINLALNKAEYLIYTHATSKAQTRWKNIVINYEVESSEPSISIAPTVGESTTIGKGQTVTLTPTINNAVGATASWQSSNEAVATIDANGVVTAKGYGTADITASIMAGQYTSNVIKITVVEPTISISANATIIDRNQTTSLNAIVNYAEGETVSWKSSSEAVATVDNNGVVTGRSYGKTNITASITVDGTTYNSNSIEVEVEKASSKKTAILDCPNVAGQQDGSNLFTLIDNGNFKVLIQKLGATNPVPWRVHANNALEITSLNGLKIKSIVITSESGNTYSNTGKTIKIKETLTSNETTLSNTNVVVNSTIATITMPEDGVEYFRVNTTSQFRMAKLEVIYEAIEIPMNNEVCFQMSSDGTAIRLLGLLIGDEYESVEFILVNDEEKTAIVPVYTIYEKVLGSSKGSQIEYTAESLGAKYIAALTLTGLTPGQGYVFSVTLKTKVTGEEAVSGQTYIVLINPDGIVEIA